MADGDDERGIVRQTIETTPCLRDSIITGITGGLFLGVATFLFTSKPVRAANVCVWAGVALLNFQFLACKIKIRETEKNHKLVREGIRAQLLTEGTAAAPDIEAADLTDRDLFIPSGELDSFEERARAKLAERVQGTVTSEAAVTLASPVQIHDGCTDCKLV
jgi:hypothetical protein